MKNKNINASNLTKTMNINAEAGGGYSPGRGIPQAEYNPRSSDKDVMSEEEKEKLEERKKAYLKKRQFDREKSKEARLASRKNRKERIEKRDAKKNPIKPKGKEVTSKKIESSISNLVEGVMEFTKEIQSFSKDYSERRDIRFRLDKMYRMSQMYIKAMKDLERRMR